MTKIPKKLQGILWSRDTKNLDLEKDSSYIINQVLAYGTIDHIRWLLKTYTKEKIRGIYTKTPMKIFTPAGFNWINKILLENLRNLDENKYIQNAHRDIRQK